jgi:hypothetical protein
MQTSQFTWRPYSQKSSSGKRFSAFAFFMGLVIAHCWHVSGNQSVELPETMAAVAKTTSQKTELAASDKLSRGSPAAETTSFDNSDPTDTAAAERTNRLAPAPSSAVTVGRQRPNHSYSIPPDRAPKRSGPSRRPRSASIAKSNSEPDYAALRDFLLNR